MSMKGYSGFMTGVATGLVVGAAVTMFTDPISEKQKKKLHRQTEGVFKNIGGVIDTAMDIMH